MSRTSIEGRSLDLYSTLKQASDSISSPSMDEITLARCTDLMIVPFGLLKQASGSIEVAWLPESDTSRGVFYSISRPIT